MKLIELCAGSAALSLHSAGLKPVIGYQGGKSGYTAAILRHLPERPSSFHLNDVGPWGTVWDTLHRPGFKERVASLIGGWAGEEPRVLRERCRELVGAEPVDIMEYSAAYLCYLAGTYGSAELGGFRGLHSRRPNVDGYIPGRQRLAERVLGFPGLGCCVSSRVGADVVVPEPDCICYIDPPYSGSNGYFNRFTRLEVLETARRWDDVGALVVVSERERLDRCLGLGWWSVDITECRRGPGLTNARSDHEWITLNY